MNQLKAISDAVGKILGSVKKDFDNSINALSSKIEALGKDGLELKTLVEGGQADFEGLKDSFLSLESSLIEKIDSAKFDPSEMEDQIKSIHESFIELNECVDAQKQGIDSSIKGVEEKLLHTVTIGLKAIEQITEKNNDGLSSAIERVSKVEDAITAACKSLEDIKNEGNALKIESVLEAIEFLKADIDSRTSDLSKNIQDSSTQFDALKTVSDSLIERELAINAKPYVSGSIYRAGEIVSHFIGRSYKALRDTYSEPESDESWTRLGNSGMKFCGVFDESAFYGVGDIYTKDGSTFLNTGTEDRIIAMRGAQGRRGDSIKGDAGKDGLNGRDGLNGKDGVSIKSVEAGDTAIVLTLTNGEVCTLDISSVIERNINTIVDRVLDHLEVEHG